MQMTDLPYYCFLDDDEKKMLTTNGRTVVYQKGEVVMQGGDCIGLITVLAGSVRTSAQLSDGRSLTLYHLGKGEVCMLSAACAFSSLSVPVSAVAEEISVLFIVPTPIWSGWIGKNANLSTFTTKTMNDHLSAILFLMDQVMTQKLDARLAKALLEEAKLQKDDTLVITHELLSEHLASSREVITRMLKCLSDEGLIALSRGKIEILNREKLEKLGQKCATV